MSAPINDGGSAFPVLENNGDRQLVLSSAGMSLRDYFAAQALTGLMAHPGSVDPLREARLAYMLADAMLKARST
ncbi:hypothetical protein OU995_11725 [Roseateles sp. SL47]|uniref:hypothetical protein n=1 Tax=Roseateles sp. SL47 TaxID=2995138 RepID=UPI002271ED7E|nr:hypothetical protein [Roseateles sp. SL47]WAC75317.1 hypothetical protein OU995_11725 [Roseateles sp. SL47]